ncbi:MAG TPA: FAD-dependent oxidoreductase [Nocardioides sp.]|nr:FAD-dependent oxidoreductase [Nocardioides sp.]
MKSVAVIGASLAGLQAARALRAQGYDGRLDLIGDEVHRPYARPPLSTTFLSGEVGLDDLRLERDGDLAANWMLGTAAASLDTRARQVVLADGRRVAVDGVVVATGARARLLAGATAGAGVHVLRTVDDALALRAELRPGARLVVVGAGLIGGEVASTARSLGCEVTIIEERATPLAGPLGTTMGALVAELHAQNDVRVLCGVGVAELVVRGRVEAVRLVDGSEYPADVVVVGIGAAPNVDWLAGSRVALGDGVLCDERGRTTMPGVVAVGDCASWHDARRGRSHRDEHWTGALERPAVAAGALLAGAGRPAVLPAATPYFWTDQYGVRIELAGHASDADSVQVEEGSPAGRDLLAVYRRAGDPVAVLGMNRGRQIDSWRRQLDEESVPA